MSQTRKNSLFSIITGVAMAFILISVGITSANVAQQLISPKSDIYDPFDQVQLLLEQKDNDRKLSRNNSFIKEAQDNGKYSQASAYIVVDADLGDVIAEKAAVQPVYIASLTKIMTAIVVSDLAKAGEEFVISETAPKVVPTNMGLVPGQSWSVAELLHGLLLTSSNDAAQAIKEGIDQKYGTGTFIRAMNAKAKFIGLKNSSFDNPQGFDGKSNFSSAEDLAILTMYLYKNYPELGEIAKKEFQHYDRSTMHKEADLPNWNGLLGVYPGVYGLKIGNTDKAQKTTIVASEREDQKILVVLLGAPGILERDTWAAQLLNLGFAKEAGLEPINITEKQLRAKYASWY